MSKRIPTTNRIRLLKGRTIYVQYKVVSELKELLIGLANNVYVPKRNMGDLLEYKLQEIAQRSPDLFARSALVQLNIQEVS